jgi:hypothetical protein
MKESAMSSAEKAFSKIAERLLIGIMFTTTVNAQNVLSGRVFVGNVGDESTPKSGVTVRLFGSSNPGIRETLLGTTTTTGTGGYSIGAPSGYEYYHIVETVPSGYQAEGASSVDGTVMSSIYIQYSIVSEPLSAQTLTDNKFWIKLEAPPNNPPHAKDDFVSTPKNTAVTIDVLNNDSDPDGDTITLQTKSSASHGTVTKSGNQIIYGPVGGYTGADQFDYSISDGKGGLDSATVYITVTEPGTTLAAIGDRAWLDVNQNGLQDAGEPGAANVWIDIYDSTGTPWMGTSTDALGMFKIYNLPPGKYTLVFSLPTGCTFTQPFQGNDPSIDSNADSNTGHTVPVILSSGEYNQTIDAGLIQQENIDFDFGDAPDTYRTVHSSGGAYHRINPLCTMGMLIDGETDGQPDPSALGDDQHGQADEDGLSFSGNLMPGNQIEICFDLRNKAANAADVWVTGWIDYNRNDAWDISTEQISPPRLVHMPPVSVVKECVSLTIPSDALTGKTFARFRMFISDNVDVPFIALPWGYGGPGEVEDYQIEILAEQQEYDFGDAPDPSYPTLLAGNGARHRIQPSFRLGSAIDGEPDGLTASLAEGDDQTGIDDEDGVIMSPFIAPGQSIPIQITASAQGAVNGWIDFNRDGDWGDPGEHIIPAQPVIAGNNSFTVTVPASAGLGLTFARFRYSSVRELGVTGEAPDGEVEDYAIEIREAVPGSIKVIKEATPEDNTNFPFCAQLSSGFFSLYCFFLQDPSCNQWTVLNPDQVIDIGEASIPGWTLKDIIVSGDNDHGSTADVTNRKVHLDFDAGENIIITFKNEKSSADSMDFGDAPDPSYPTLLASNGARHKIDPTIYMGSQGVDAEPDGQPSIHATGDDSNGINDENGVGYGILVSGETGRLSVSVSAAGYLNAWYDSNGDGDWNDSGEQIAQDFLLTAGMHDLFINIPVQAPADGIGRFRFSTQAGLSFTGPAPDGEVEDRILPIRRPDFGDAPSPYPTLHADNGARHAIAGPVLGTMADWDQDGQPQGNAMGDDLDGSDDDDGILFTSTLSPGQTATISVIASHEELWALFNGWIDFNGDKDWDDAGEHIFDDVTVYMGINQLSFNVPVNAAIGKTFARFRITTHSLLNQSNSPVGFVTSGEVEDYAVDIGASGTGSLTIIKDATPKDDTPFWITTSWGFMGGAAPYRDPSANSSTMNGGPAGTYYLGEAVPAGWTLKDIVITGDNDHGSSINVGNRTIDVDLDDGELITVVFKNEKTGDAGFDHGDAPLGYPDASHPLGGPWLGGPGDKPDADPSMQNDPHAQGDDQDGNDDEDCVTLANFIQGQGGKLHLIMNSGPTGSYTDRLWIDFNQDGDWDDPGERLGGAATNGPKNSMGWANYYLSSLYQIPAGKLIARVRIYEGIVISPSVSGPGTAGEVEDFEIEVKAGGAPIPQGAVIYGAKWNDLDGNSQWDANEPPLPDWTIWLDLNHNGAEDSGDLYDKTDASGQFEFSGLSAGTYIVGEKLKSGWVQTWPGGSASQTMTVDPQQPNAGILFGNRHTNPGLGEGAVKWNQPPLYDPMGADTTAYRGRAELSVYSDSFLADDWFCHDPRPVIRIRWWGSYAAWEGSLPPDDAPPYFHLGIWSDMPKGNGSDFGHPDTLIHEWFVERSQVQETAQKHHWLPEIMPVPLTCFQYTFYLPQETWFFQNGEKNVYWLHIAAVYPESRPDHPWGWLCRERYFRGEGIRFHQPVEPHPGQPYLAGEPIDTFWDMAFVLGTDEYESDFDFGDLPEIYGTALSGNGPHHLIRPGIYLGERIDAEYNGQAHMEAQGDDDDGLDDEDGVQMIYPLVIGGQPEFLVKASVSGFLNGWIDRERDGNFYDPVDHIIQNAELRPGDNVITATGAFNGIEPGQRMARFRFSTEPDLWFKGFAMDGEVEDLMMMIYAADDVSADQQHIPSAFRLSQNYPNPFNPNTAIPYDVPRGSHVKITLYNLAGQQIVQLVNAYHEPGQYKIIWHGLDATGNAVSSGIYVVLMEAGSFRKTGKLVLIR